MSAQPVSPARRTLRPEPATLVIFFRAATIGDVACNTRGFPFIIVIDRSCLFESFCFCCLLVLAAHSLWRLIIPSFLNTVDLCKPWCCQRTTRLRSSPNFQPAYLHLERRHIRYSHNLLQDLTHDTSVNCWLTFLPRSIARGVGRNFPSDSSSQNVVIVQGQRESTIKTTWPTIKLACPCTRWLPTRPADIEDQDNRHHKYRQRPY